MANSYNMYSAPTWRAHVHSNRIISNRIISDRPNLLWKNDLVHPLLSDVYELYMSYESAEAVYMWGCI